MVNGEIEKLKKEIEAIKERNRRVEKDKAWETSLIRKIFIAVSTYLLILLLMLSLKVEKPFLSSVIPAVAYLISTASLNVIKKWWLQKTSKKP
jgi:hypothetical protein